MIAKGAVSNQPTQNRWYDAIAFKDTLILLNNLISYMHHKEI